MKRIPRGILGKARKIKLLLLDVDGVLTDGGIVLSDDGSETKRFDVRDGHRIKMLIKAGVRVGFVTGRSSAVVRRRAGELGVRLVYQKVDDKADAYREIKRKTRLKDDQIAYVGDDLIDLPVLRRAGWAVAVRDCCEEIKPAADYVTRRRGGRGAVCEVIELLLRAQGKWRQATKAYFQD